MRFTRRNQGKRRRWPSSLLVATVVVVSLVFSFWWFMFLLAGTTTSTIEVNDFSTTISSSSSSSALLLFDDHRDNTVAVSSTAAGIGEDHDKKKKKSWRAEEGVTADGKAKAGAFPQLLFKYNVYNVSRDFVNEIGRTPPYWVDQRTGQLNNGGPCYAPSIHKKQTWIDHIEWNKLSSSSSSDGGDNNIFIDKAMYPNYNRKKDKGQMIDGDLTDFCRPGFLIIGAGKCGTTSLYQYLLKHPRVMPATTKQVHYFKYSYERKSIKWYYSHFPSATNFLSSGALITGEASPGYLPYPEVPNVIRSKMNTNEGGSGSNGNEEMEMPRIIIIGRDPIERMYSSYKYNYVTPTLEILRQGQNNLYNHYVKANQTDDYYVSRHLFSFEDMIRAELKVLKRCLIGDGEVEGYGARRTRELWAVHVWYAKAQSERRRDNNNNKLPPPLIDLLGVCYDNIDGDDDGIEEELLQNTKVLKPQWIGLFNKHPSKVISKHKNHLTSTLIGRSMYSLMLEWWYPFFDNNNIYFVCTEELQDLTGQSMNRLGLWLGLPSYNFSSVVSQGAYNVGGHEKGAFVSFNETSSTSSNTAAVKGGGGGAGESQQQRAAGDDNKLPAELKQELLDFMQPYNERLFELTGKRCHW